MEPDDRYPTLTDAGRAMLRFLSEHPHAPIYRDESGNRLTREEVARVRELEREDLKAPISWRPGSPPGWVEPFAEECCRDVPYFRDRGRRPFDQLPTTSRADLSQDVVQFVPDSVPCERLIHFSTSGTTGHPLLIPSHPVVAARYLAYHKRALARFGVELAHRRGQVGVVLVGFQERCFTYVSVTPTMGESGLAKINLHPADWRRPEDRALYLDALAPEVLTGDPISLAELAGLPLRHRPRAVLSTSMALLPGLRQEPEERFRCPVLDLYSLNEVGPVAVLDARLGGHVLLQPRLYVEVLDAEGHEARRGEVTLTGGFNFCLPLLRYRTGDHATLEVRDGELVLVELAGRPPVRFRTRAGSWINNIEVTHALQRFALPRWALHQHADGSIHLRAARVGSCREQVERALLELFGDDQRLLIEELTGTGEKLVQYTSDLEAAT